MKHVDLFSGIGGFALAVDWAYEGAEHTFCEIDPFCQKVLKKHWPKAEIHDDIKQFKADNLGRVDLLTGGFPCQPFSVAGKQRAQEDDRHLWPEMFRIIKECRPSWIIGENVTGIIELALEQVCLDLEGEGYEVWPIIIPACAVNAPHRRDRVWIIANSTCSRRLRQKQHEDRIKSTDRRGRHESIEKDKGAAANAESKQDRRIQQPWIQRHPRAENAKNSWNSNWTEVATEFCSVDDGLPAELDGLKLSKSRNRAEQLKAYGNAIVPQVAYEIIKRISSKESHNTTAYV